MMDNSSQIVEDVKWFMFDDESKEIKNENGFSHGLQFVTRVGDGQCFIVKDADGTEYRIRVSKEMERNQNFNYETEAVMNDLDYLGGALENFYKDGIINSHLTPVIITVKENEKTLAHGTAFEIKENLKDKYTRKILKWDFTYYKWEIFCNV